VEGAQVRGVVRPAERGERPQGGGEPGVEHVRILVPALGGLLVRANGAHLAVRSIKNRNTVAPPQLAADGPVVHVVDPAEVPGVHLRRGEPDAAVADRVAGRLGQWGDADEPLQRLARLDRGAAAAAVADGVHVRADLGDNPALLPQRGDHGGAGPPAGQPPGPRARAWKRRSPWNAPCAVITPSSSMMVRLGRSCRRPISKSFGSWAGVTLT